MKILILGLAKSGTTALAYKIHESLGSTAKLHFEPGKIGGAEDSTLHDGIIADNRSCVTKNLIFPTNETRWDEIFSNVHKYDRAVWIVRDPRDIIISNFFYHWFQGHKAAREKFNTALERTLRKEAKPACIPFIDLVSGTMTENRAQLEAWQNSWYDILSRASDQIIGQMHVLKYEDFVDENFSRLNEYLGLALTGATRVPDEHRRVVRTRSYGNWRRWFTSEDVEFFRPILQDFLDKMGYDASDWKLENPESLTREEGSEYRQKTFNRKSRNTTAPLLIRI